MKQSYACYPLHVDFLLGLFLNSKDRGGDMLSSEMSVGFQQTTRCYIPEDRTLYITILFFSIFSLCHSSQSKLKQDQRKGLHNYYLGCSAM
jgi:hypothetical protein